MAFLLDTNILARLTNATDPGHLVAAAAVVELHRRNEMLHITPQNLVEFRNVATRAKELNGLGLTNAEAESKAELFEETFPLLPENAAIFPAWKRLVSSAAIIGKQVHDARLVAVCEVHSITNLLTFNVGHFTRTAALVGVVVVHPATV